MLRYREQGEAALPDDFADLYRPARGNVNLKHPYSHLDDLGNTMINWLECTQFVMRDGDGRIRILSDRQIETPEAAISDRNWFVSYTSYSGGC